jgi:glycosyltransferase involved in cell wall biosynthesis
MIVCHIVTRRFSPQTGGLEASAFRIARTLARCANVSVVVHVLAEDYPLTANTYHGMDLSLIGVARKELEEPLAYGRGTLGDIVKQYEIQIERARLDYLLLRNAVEERMLARPHARHAIISFLMSHAGIIAQRVADSAGIPHILGVRGSDFSLHLHDNIQLSGITMALKNCRRIVTTNREQERLLDAFYGVGDKTATIHNSLEPEQLETAWRASSGEAPLLVSDSGYSFKKGTHLLMRGFEHVRAQGVRARLIIAGTTEASTKAYWQGRKQEMAERYGGDVEFRDHQSLADVARLLESGHMYCSATLGEGCSLARAAALVAGIPIVSTRCGELPDLAADASHVAIARPGDADGYARSLAEMCARVAGGDIRVDEALIARWKRYFHPVREAREWRAVVGDVVDADLVPIDCETEASLAAAAWETEASLAAAAWETDAPLAAAAWETDAPLAAAAWETDAPLAAAGRKTEEPLAAADCGSGGGQ